MYQRLGAGLFLFGLLQHLEDADYFGRRVLPLVRELEAGRDAAGVSAPGHGVAR